MTDDVRGNDCAHMSSTSALWAFHNESGVRNAYSPLEAYRFGRHVKQALTRCARHTVKGDNEPGQIVVISKKVSYGHVQHQPHPEQRAGVWGVLASLVLIDPG